MAIDKQDGRTELLGQSLEIIDRTIEEIRKLSRSLVAPKFQEESLNDSLLDMISDIELVAPFKINYTCNILDENILTEEKKVMYSELHRSR